MPPVPPVVSPDRPPTPSGNRGAPPDGGPGWASAALVAAGAAALSGSGVFVVLTRADPGTVAFLRCLIALPVLAGPLAWEWRRRGRVSVRAAGWACAAGVLLGLDYLAWAVGIALVGAGVATVLVNIQVVVFPLLARVLDGTPLSRRFVLAVPLMLGGVALAGGLLASGPARPGAVTGTVLSLAAGLAYAGYLYLSRRCARDHPRHRVTPVALATAAAALVTGCGTVPAGGPMAPPDAVSWAWLVVLALVGQVLAWLLIAAGSARLPAPRAAALLLLQPVLAVPLAMLAVGERPTTAQLVGCVVVVVAIRLATSAARLRRAGEPPAGG